MSADSMTKLGNQEPVVRVRGLSKTFAATKVLDDVSLDLLAGEVVAVVGQNGSGKSTFVKILAGYHEPDPGARVDIMGKELRLGDPLASRSADVRFVHQDLALIGTLSAIENFALTTGYVAGRAGIRWAVERKRVLQAVQAIGFEFDVDIPVERLKIGERVGLAIARALADVGGSDGPSLLVLDEPTACLPRAEVTSLFEAIRAVSAGGVPVLFVSHRLDEVFEISDRVLILRDGLAVACCETSSLNHDELISLMLGGELERTENATETTPRPSDEIVFEVDGLRGQELERLDLRLAKGRMVGITGLIGSGAEEVAPLLSGEKAPVEGSVKVNGSRVPSGSPFHARRAGIGYVPSERREKALVPNFSLVENLTLLDLGPFSSIAGLNGRAELAEANGWIDALDVRPRAPRALIGAFSGGNQQKVVLGRLLRVAPAVIVVDEPTQGVDVGAKAAIHQLLREAAAAGSVVVMRSSDTEELVDLADEVIVLRNGSVAEVFSGMALSDVAIDRAALGGGAE